MLSLLRELSAIFLMKTLVPSGISLLTWIPLYSDAAWHRKIGTKTFLLATSLSYKIQRLTTNTTQMQTMVLVNVSRKLARDQTSMPQVLAPVKFSFKKVNVCLLTDHQWKSLLQFAVNRDSRRLVKMKKMLKKKKDQKTCKTLSATQKTQCAVPVPLSPSQSPSTLIKQPVKSLMKSKAKS